MMHKDEAMEIAFNADTMTVEELLAAYIKFHHKVEETPTVTLTYYANQGDCELDTITYKHERSLHGAIGLATEAAEILDAHKKMIFGKRKPLTEGNIREECGDVFFYLTLVMDAHGITLRDIVKDNVVKLANRYIEKFEVS